MKSVSFMFPMVGFGLLTGVVNAQTGACCSGTAAPTCQQVSESECLAQDGLFQGVDSGCGICYDGITWCDEYADCDPPDPGTCILFPYHCEFAACCDETQSTCVETFENSDCSGTVCDNDPEIVGCTAGQPCGTDGTCVDLSGFNFQGFGTACDGPNAVCQSPIPATSEWGLAALTLLVLAAGTVVLKRRRVAQA